MHIKWLWEILNMPATLGGQFTIIAAVVGGAYAIINYARKMFQLWELTIKTLLWAARQRGDFDVPDWLADQYKSINGHAKASTEELKDVLGEKHVKE
jgi:hypothetical protein